MPNEIVIYEGKTPATTGSRDGATFGIGAFAGGLTLGQPSTMNEHLMNPLQIVPSTAESNVGKVGEDDLFDNKSGSENHDDGSGDNDRRPGGANQRPRKRQFHRHTQQQIQQMEAFFKDCPRPDDKQRNELSLLLGLEPLQIKFWFQNKRTHIKMQQERHESQGLRAENEKLRAENMRYREAIANSSCPTCGGPKSAPRKMSHDEHNLRMENAKLKEEIDRITTVAARYISMSSPNCPLVSPPPVPFPLDFGNFNPQLVAGRQLYGMGDLAWSIAGLGDQAEKTVAKLAAAAMEEFAIMAQTTHPLWIANTDTGCYVLDKEEYFAAFPRGIGPRPVGFRTEASREIAVVRMNHLTLIELLMDVNQWSTAFSGIVSGATVLEVLSAGVGGNYNGALQKMTAEFHVPTPIVPIRETNFARFCRKLGDGSWAVVDVSLDGFWLYPLRCRRRASGCLIEEIPGGRSKVTWVEHVEVEDRHVHNAYERLLRSGLAFGATRWLATLDRHCERFASAMATNIPNCGITNTEGRRSLMKLAERMMINFCGGVSSSTAQSWTTISESEVDDDFRVITRKRVDDLSRPSGIVLCATTSFWLPFPPKTVFDFLRDHNSRNQWDILANGGRIEEITHIPSGRGPGNRVSLLKVAAAGGGEDHENGTVDNNNNGMIIVQETSSDSTGCFMVYAPVDKAAMDMVLGGGDPSYVALLPSGFALLPDGFGLSAASRMISGRYGGCVLTVGFQILVNSSPNAKLTFESVATVNNLIACTVERIKDSMLGEN